MYINIKYFEFSINIIKTKFFNLNLKFFHYIIRYFNYNFSINKNYESINYLSLFIKT